MPAGKATEPVDAIDRAIQILDAFTIENPELGVAELSRLLGLKRSTVHRALTTLEAGGLLRQAPTTQKYSLGPKILNLARVAESNLSLASVALPGMRALRDYCNETVALHVLEGRRRVVIRQVESTHDLRRTYRQMGKPLPLHAGSPGRVLLAYLPPDELRSILDEIPLVAYTPRTLTDRSQLLAELEEIRKRGFAMSAGEHSHDISSVSCPVRNHQGRVIACINISGPVSRLTEAKCYEYLGRLREVALSVSRQLGYAGPPDED